MDLLFAINQGYTKPFLRCMTSVLRNGGFDRYCVHILHSDLRSEDQTALQTALGSRVQCSFYQVDPALFEGFPESKRYPRQIYYRLAAPLLLPESLDRVLYLDADTIVINSLIPLSQEDFGDSCFMACTHTRKALSRLNQVRLGVGKDVPYINTGVMVYNLPALRQNLRLEDIRRWAESGRPLLLPDQDILTALYGDRVKLLDDLIYNLSDRIFSFHNADPRRAPIDLDWVRKNTVVIHYCGKRKPWGPNYSGVLGVFYYALFPQEAVHGTY